MKFSKVMQKELINLGAEPFISDKYQFDLNTKYGILWIRIDLDESDLYTVFSRFVDVETIPKHIQGVNTWSGKYNFHLSKKHNTVNEAVNYIFNNLKELI